MKNMNINKFMMLLVLAVGSMSQVKAYHENACPSHDEHKDIKRIEKDIHEIRQNIDKHGSSAKTYKELDELDAQAKHLCASCHPEHEHMCKTHEHTLERKIKNARKLADKHHAEKPAKAKEVKNKKSKDKDNDKNVKIQSHNDDKSSHKKAKAKGAQKHHTNKQAS